LMAGLNRAKGHDWLGASYSGDSVDAYALCRPRETALPAN
jgi:hypothetical protein